MTSIPTDLTEVQRRLRDALAHDVARNNPPKLHGVPVVMASWDMQQGLIRIAHTLQSELDVHIVYLRVCDLQLTFSEMMHQAAIAQSHRPELKKLGEVMAGTFRPSIVGD